MTVAASRRALLLGTAGGAGALALVANAPGSVAAPRGAVLDSDPGLAEPLARAARWLADRTGTGTPVTTESEVWPDRAWTRDWTGPLTGTCVLVGVAEEVRERAEVRAWATTDSRYPAGTTGLDAGGRFAFPDSPRGAKSLEVVDPATGDILAEWAPSTGLVRSYDVPGGDPRAGRCWTYDQSLAVLAALAVGDDDSAAELGSGLLRLQVGGRQDGAFVVNAAAIDPEGADREHRTGSSAVATYALLSWARRLRETDADGETLRRVLSAAARGERWLRAQQLAGGRRTGLVTGGRGEWRAGRLRPDVRIEWAAAEHALDCWQTWDLAATVLPSPGGRRAARRARAAVERGLLRMLWRPGRGTFRRGYGPDGPDNAEALDGASWGAVFLAGSGRRGLASRALVATGRYAVEDAGVSGHRPYQPQPAFPRPPVLVWVEGTCGVALAEAALGRPGRAASTLRGLVPLQGDDGAFPYATAPDDLTGMDTAPSVAGTAWWLLAASYGGPQGSIWEPSP